MDDTDLAGPLLFCFVFGVLLLFSGKSQFGYVYGVGLMGVISIYLLLNLMSEGGIDASRVTSVLGYCLLPLCFWFRDIPTIYIMVLHVGIGHFRVDPQLAKPTLPRRVPRGSLLCMLCATKCI